jgi:hypothetical protein
MTALVQKPELREPWERLMRVLAHTQVTTQVLPDPQTITRNSKVRREGADTGEIELLGCTVCGTMAQAARESLDGSVCRGHDHDNRDRSWVVVRGRQVGFPPKR